MWAEATAPGRIDFLGGVADYSGSWVLEAPIHRETKVAIKSAEHWTFQSNRPMTTLYQTDSGSKHRH